MSERTVQFVNSLAVCHPTLALILDEHRRDNFDEVLPHLFFGDVTRYVVSVVESAARQHELRQLLDNLEGAYASGDPEIQELLSVSFLENLPRPGEIGSQVRQMLGPSLATQLREIG